MCVVAVLALVIASWPGSDAKPGPVAGLAAGLLRLLFGSWALIRAVPTPELAT
jgi:hypothetical protein